MLNGQYFRDCVRINSYDTKIKNVEVTLFENCVRSSDCTYIEPTPTPTPTPSLIPSNNNLPKCAKEILIVRTVEAGVCSSDGWCQEYGFEIWKYNPSTLSITLMSYIEHDTPLAETWDITYFYNPVT